MADAFPKPRKAMGEAWFMGERRLFPELLGNLDELTNEQIWEPLEELASGQAASGSTRSGPSGITISCHGL
jgi:hypothetical protein